LGRRRDIETHDLSIRLTGPAVLQAQLLFLEDWHFETGDGLEDSVAFPQPEAAGRPAMQVLPSGPMYPSPTVRDLLVFALHQAERRVILSTPYLVPDEAVMLALCLAVRRGVEVDVIVPQRSDLPLVDAAGRAYSREPTGEGARIHVHRAGFLHAKTLTVDDTLGMLGSANYDIRSFRLNVEANLLLYSGEPIQALRRRQEGYIAASRLLDPDALQGQSRLGRLGEDVARLFGPLM